MRVRSNESSREEAPKVTKSKKAILFPFPLKVLKEKGKERCPYWLGKKGRQELLKRVYFTVFFHSNGAFTRRTVSLHHVTFWFERAWRWYSSRWRAPPFFQNLWCLPFRTFLVSSYIPFFDFVTSCHSFLAMPSWRWGSKGSLLARP